MRRQTRVSHPIHNLLPTEIDGFDPLAALALDMRWSWNHATDDVWRQLDPELWEITHNPWVVLQTVSRERIERVLGDPVFRKEVDGLVEESRHDLEREWPALGFGEVKVETEAGQHVFEVEVHLAGLDPGAVRVELFADGVDGAGPLRQEMASVRRLAEAAGGHVYSARVSATRPASDFTPRLVPHHDGAAVPLEAGQILWQR